MTTDHAHALFKVEDLYKYYEGKSTLMDLIRGKPKPRLVAVDGVSLTLCSNEVLGLVGESGSGKSTTARCIIRLETPDHGTVVFDNQDVLTARPEALRQIRRDMQMIYQDPYSSLNPRLSIQTAISEPALVHGLVDKEGAEALVRELLERVGLPYTVANLRPRALSGGQRQRVAIARALALKPRVIIADEAVSALDVSIQAQILNLFGELIRDLELGMIFIAHQLSVIAQLSDRVAIMYLGRIVETGPTVAIFTNPRHPYTGALLAAHPHVEVGKKPEAALKGEMPSPYAIPTGCRFHTQCPFAEDKCREIDPPPTQVSPEHYAWCHVLPELTQSRKHLYGEIVESQSSALDSKTTTHKQHG
ncbi:MAG: ABC transporter ATP-binding protein [Chloroflexi bacterium]|nr:ABC transporter ATP-binding protein [Chloroflexota bacterium]